jgi:dihydropteroate synthase
MQFHFYPDCQILQCYYHIITSSNYQIDQMFTLNCRGKLLVINEPIVMGIINTTPDSFYGGSRQSTIDGAVQKAGQMLAEGATILDIGGQSTRPGAALLDAEEELGRVIPVIEAIHTQFPAAVLSIDTYHSRVAEKAVDSGASIINDISGGNFDENMLDTVAALATPYVCMHIKGRARDMHESPQYENLVKEVLDYFIQQVEICRQKGIEDIIIDPGFGFSKNSTHNFTLLKNLEVFSMLGKPVLLGISRKSTIYKTLGITVEEALNGTTVLHTAGLLKGAAILRVHDVKEAVEAIKLTAYLK